VAPLRKIGKNPVRKAHFKTHDCGTRGHTGAPRLVRVIAPRSRLSCSVARHWFKIFSIRVEPIRTSRRFAGSRIYGLRLPFGSRSKRGRLSCAVW